MLWQSGPSVADGLKDTNSFRFMGVFPAVLFPVTGIGLRPLFLAQLLVELIVRVRFHLISLPGRLLGSSTLGFLAGGLILVPWAWVKETSTVNTYKFLHNHLLLLRENGTS